MAVKNFFNSSSSTCSRDGCVCGMNYKFFCEHRCRISLLKIYAPADGYFCEENNENKRFVCAGTIK